MRLVVKNGMNSSEMKKTNRSLVLKTLLENGSMTRTDLSESVKLQKATITNIINEFAEIGIIEVDGVVASGRRGELVTLKLDHLSIMSVSINRKEYQIRLCSLKGETIEQTKVEFDSRQDINQVVDRLKEDAKGIISRHGKENVIGVSLGLPGPYIRREDKGLIEVNIVSQFEQLSLVNIHRELEEALGIKVLSEHDAKFSAYAEWRNAEEAQENPMTSLLTFTSIGMGIGAGIIIDGKIVKGMLGVAGEIGHMGINYNGKFINGQYDSSFEYCAGTESCVRYMMERLYEFPDSILNEKSTYTQIVEAYKKGDELAVYAMEKMAWFLGYGIASIIYILNPDCIIIGQSYPDYEPFLAKVKASVEKYVHPSILDGVSIRNSKITTDTVLLGGYYVVLNKLIKDGTLINIIKRNQKMQN